MALSTAALVSVVAQQPSAPAVAAPGLHLFPLREHLMNTYYLMRACETVSDARQIISSNPVDKLSVRLHGLTPAGVEQARGASTALADAGVGASAWLWPSVTMSAFETAEILAYCLNIRREQIVPEFSFLDARGVGRLDGGRESDVRRVIAQNDRLDSNWRPTPGEDGTPNDSTEDVFVRVRQLLSKLETQYEGESIVILAPDSDPLSILQAAMTGVDLRSHHQCEFMPGEIRYVKELVVDSFGNVTDQSEAKTLFKPT